MVYEDIDDPDASRSTIVLQSNLSISLDELAAVFLLLSAVTLTVALLPTLMGYWPVLVLAVIHLLIVGWCFRLAWRGHWARQRIEIDDATVRVSCVSARHRSETVWPAAWTRLEQVASGTGFRVFLAYHDQRLEMGPFLPPAERQAAASRLRQALCRHGSLMIASTPNIVAKQGASE